MNLWFDFDGTLVDVREKYLTLYRSFCHQHGAEKPLSDDTFWQLKRDGRSNTELAAKSGLCTAVAGKFSAFVEANVELDVSLRRDRLFAQTTEVLRELSKVHSCRLISMRRDYKSLLRQVEWLDIRDCFEQVLEVDRGASTDFTPKAEAIRRLGETGRALIIGDSEMEIRTARQLKISSCSIATGIRSRERLMALSPDYFIEALPDIFSVVSDLASGPE
jgi:phosphoglycolate phosphatase-like HAD superfamily hydrolase